MKDHEQRVLAAVETCPGLTARALADETGLGRPAVYVALRGLESRGDVERSDDWPAGWMPKERTPESPETAADDHGEALDAVGDLLAEAMAHSDWAKVPRSIQYKVEHAWVEVQRARGDGVY